LYLTPDLDVAPTNWRHKISRTGGVEITPFVV